MHNFRIRHFGWCSIHVAQPGKEKSSIRDIDLPTTGAGVGAGAPAVAATAAKSRVPVCWGGIPKFVDSSNGSGYAGNLFPTPDFLRECQKCAGTRSTRATPKPIFG